MRVGVKALPGDNHRRSKGRGQGVTEGANYRERGPQCFSSSPVVITGSHSPESALCLAAHCRDEAKGVIFSGGVTPDCGFAFTV